MSQATAILRHKVIDEEGDIVELTIWSVPVTASAPIGVRYRLVFIRAGEATPAVLYDNHHPKGPHRHVENVEESYAFRGVDRLLVDFRSDVGRIKGARR